MKEKQVNSGEDFVFEKVSSARFCLGLFLSKMKRKNKKSGDAKQDKASWKYFWIPFILVGIIPLSLGFGVAKLEPLFGAGMISNIDVDGQRFSHDSVLTGKIDKKEIFHADKPINYVYQLKYSEYLFYNKLILEIRDSEGRVSYSKNVSWGGFFLRGYTTVYRNNLGIRLPPGKYVATLRVQVLPFSSWTAPIDEQTIFSGYYEENGQETEKEIKERIQNEIDVVSSIAYNEKNLEAAIAEIKKVRSDFDNETSALIRERDDSNNPPSEAKRDRISRDIRRKIDLYYELGKKLDAFEDYQQRLDEARGVIVDGRKVRGVVSRDFAGETMKLIKEINLHLQKEYPSYNTSEKGG